MTDVRLSVATWEAVYAEADQSNAAMMVFLDDHPDSSVANEVSSFAKGIFAFSNLRWKRDDPKLTTPAVGQTP